MTPPEEHQQPRHHVDEEHPRPEPQQQDPDLAELEELERDLAALERELEIADASGDEVSEPSE